MDATAKFMIIATAAMIAAAGSAQASVFDFVETASTVPGLTITAELDIAGNGTLADLPTLSSPPCVGCTDFGDLDGLSLAWSASPPPPPNAAGAQFSLADFTAPITDSGCGQIELCGLPRWSISPSAIEFINSKGHGDLDFFILGIDTPSTTIRVDEAGQFGSACFVGGACVQTGFWRQVSVDEPAPSVLWLLPLLAGTLVVRRCRGRSFAFFTSASSEVRLCDIHL